MGYPINKRRQPVLRTGVSAVQTITCLIAVGAGAWIGANYMGLNLNHIAYTALEETNLLEQVPPEWRPEKGDCPFMECETKSPPDQFTDELTTELTALQQEVQKLRQAAMIGEPPHDVTNQQDTEFQRRRDQTIAYWARLCEVADQVAKLDQDVQPALTRETTGHVFDLRRRVFDFGRRSIEEAETAGVDPQAVEAGNRMIAWYTQGESFYADAIGVWDNLTGSQNSTTAVQDSIEQARTHFGKQTDLLRVKLGELSSLLSRRYGVMLPTVGV